MAQSRFFRYHLLRNKRENSLKKRMHTRETREKPPKQQEQREKQEQEKQEQALQGL
jgi:hypothetical protein